MRTKLLGIILIATFLSGFSSLFAQGFQPSAKGKAVVYFVRVTSMGFAITFRYFHQNTYQ